MVQRGPGVVGACLENWTPDVNAHPREDERVRRRNLKKICITLSGQPGCSGTGQYLEKKAHQCRPINTVSGLEIDEHCLNQQRRGRIGERKTRVARNWRRAGTPSERTADLGGRGRADLLTTQTPRRKQAAQSAATHRLGTRAGGALCGLSAAAAIMVPACAWPPRMPRSNGGRARGRARGKGKGRVPVFAL